MIQFSYWPMTVVTGESEKDKLLMKYLKLYQKWQNLSIQSGFETWKKEISLKLEATVKVRKDIENQLREYNRLQNDLDRFYDGFPSTTFEKLSARLNQLENENMI